MYFSKWTKGRNRRDNITVNAKLIIQYVRKGESYNTKGGITGGILFNRA